MTETNVQAGENGARTRERLALEKGSPAGELSGRSRAASPESLPASGRLSRVFRMLGVLDGAATSSRPWLRCSTPDAALFELANLYPPDAPVAGGRLSR